ncbi:hypothetical protein JW926_11160, partial [Candidatus Sumerlaeota bacterium]|nr:hypothetical protein [Candidatus Sumerlaeota bacterium]
IAPFLSGGVSLAGAGIFMSLYIRKTHTAFWGALTSTAFIMILWQFMIKIGFSIFGMGAILYGDGFQIYGYIINMALPLLLWGVLAYILARRRFLSLEV